LFFKVVFVYAYVLDDSADDTINPRLTLNIKRHNNKTNSNSNNLNTPDENANRVIIINLKILNGKV